MQRTLFSATALREILSVAIGLGAREVAGWSDAEQQITADLPEAGPSTVGAALAEIEAGGDPLGSELCRIRTPEERRPHGATYTPPAIVESMLGWAADHCTPARVVDPGAGSGRFLVAAGRAFPRASLVAVEIDPAAAVLCRGHLAAAGLAGRCEVKVADYRAVELGALPEGQSTLFIGNPPYVRHHLIEPAWKEWLATEGRAIGLRPSRLAGLHVHFFLATALKARVGDFACFVTSAEWLDVNYGRMVRELFLNGLGGSRLVIVDPAAKPFADADTTAAIVCMQVGAEPSTILVGRAADCSELGCLQGGRAVARKRLRQETRWSRLTSPRRKVRDGYVQLGELFRVHRGQVTGANAVWIAGEHSRRLPASLLHPTVTRASELYGAAPELRTVEGLRKVIDLPPDLDSLDDDDREAVEAFLIWAKARGAHEGYVARHRKPWWSVGLRRPAPIIASYMARRPPAFVRNTAGARHLNIAHGLYPRVPLSDRAVRKLVAFLAANVKLSDGRMYAGGLTKFEPREMERLPVPGPEMLRASGED